MDRRSGRARACVELVVVREDDDRGLVVWRDSRERLVGPRDQDLVGARQPLIRRELAARVGDDRAPAELLRGAAELFGRVHRPDHEQARRRLIDLAEDAAARQLEQLVAAPADQLRRSLGELGRTVTERLTALEDEQLRAERLALDDGEERRTLLPLHDLLQALVNHWRRSTKTSISPPHGRPTVHASSSEMPYVSSFGVPDWRTSRAFS